MRSLTVLLTAFVSIACSHTPTAPLTRAENVNINRFMGNWYVIANIPTFIEKGAHNAIESYSLNKDGSIATRFSFYKDSFDGELKLYEPTGYVSKTDNSLWGMQFIWPFKAEYVITYLSADYQHTIIGRSARDYLWIMSREPVMDEKSYKELIEFSAVMGYNTDLIEKVPQQWPEKTSKNHINTDTDNMPMENKP